MMDLDQLPPSETGEYCCTIALNLYDSPHCKALATQAAAQRHLIILSQNLEQGAIAVRLCEDGYEGWLQLQDLSYLTPAINPYQPISVSRLEIEAKIPAIIEFTKAAMAVSNYYLWGGTIAPNYDCSGLIQAAFANSGIWLPRDSYQQADFTESINRENLLPGDLIFFAKNNKVDHVALYLGDNYYLHSSGKEIGRNGIGIDQLSDCEDPVSKAYFKRFWGCGRVMSSYFSDQIKNLV